MLSDDAKTLLALYLEFFGRLYSVNDDRKLSCKDDAFTRHIEMQNIIFILKEMGVCLYGTDYHFELNGKIGPYSLSLQVILNSIDEAGEEEIIRFYRCYCKERCNYAMMVKDYSSQLIYTLNSLTDIHDPDDAEKIAKISLVLKDILKEPDGSRIVAAMIYLTQYLYDMTTYTFQFILTFLNDKCCPLSKELAEKIWKSLQVLGLIPVLPKKETIGELQAKGPVKKFVPSPDESK